MRAIFSANVGCFGVRSAGKAGTEEALLRRDCLLTLTLDGERTLQTLPALDASTDATTDPSATDREDWAARLLRCLRSDSACDNSDIALAT
mmetsp:Transcript_6/g.16  ORF Transcript_6/g.16 Transcript_6/m.16 type:complete len:91 (+) Transcript_6:450-722(+)